MSLVRQLRIHRFNVTIGCIQWLESAQLTPSSAPMPSTSPPAADTSPRYLAIAHQLYVHNMVTHVFPLDKINPALDLVRAGEAGRVLIEMQPHQTRQDKQD